MRDWRPPHTDTTRSGQYETNDLEGLTLDDVIERLEALKAKIPGDALVQRYGEDDWWGVKMWFKWTRPETDEEREERLKEREAYLKKQEAKEREAYAALHEKYGTP